MEDLIEHLYRTICHTEGCPLNGVVHEDYHFNDHWICGPCGKYITDVKIID
jgi:hypothetical protein